ncbi:MAG TPA: UDP-N-acetylglucosamine 2-epimerase (non-hydrolyzing), partial [Erythrobacter sp.]|nr:UDP-N-acetylglucosamine 2-epimerase (non-hydrolyzing) [Erythrobacter sp.]
PALADGLRALEERFAGRRIIGVTSHRRENFGEGMQAIAKAVKSIASRQDVAVIFPVHLNPQVRAVMKAELAGLNNVALLEPLDYPQFARLLDISHLMLTDSGGVQEEAPALGKPVLVMRETTERPEGIAAGTARLVGTDADRIVRETNRLLDDPAAYAAMAQAHNPFGDGHAAERIADLLAAS